jgi:hypothetical protein
MNVTQSHRKHLKAPLGGSAVNAVTSVRAMT